MNIYSAFTLFAFIILIYMIIAELFTVVFRFTGLDEEKARFQVVSLLTGAGFTTAESELVVSSKQRRKLARWIMMFGYVFNITFVSAFINIFLSLKQTEIHSILLDIAMPLGLVILLVAILRVPAIRNWTDKQIRKIIDRLMGGSDFNPLMVVDKVGDNSIITVLVKKLPDELSGRKLSDSELKSRHHILVLLVRPEGSQPSDAHADTMLKDGDEVTLYGDYQTICKVFHARELYRD
ncbi:MAG: TrkA C-terminal domain-containing protein [Erysipelotrichaceae bacterium]|nr:TrkA C-terminal domain-containing protein [Erysipelotrichaceae bacterium]